MWKSALLGCILLSHAVAQTIPYEPNYVFGLSMPFVNRWQGAFALDLVPVRASRTGKVWFRQVPEGLLIFGRADGSAPQYAQSAEEMASRGYVGVWLSFAHEIAMPEIGWGNQFGLTNCRKDPRDKKAVADCTAWEARQQRYREQLRHVFVRHWQLAPGLAIETYASPAERASFGAAEVRGKPSFDTTISTDGSVYFEVLVHWSDLPPANTLELTSIQVAVEFRAGEQDWASTAKAARAGAAPELRELQFARPKRFTVSACGYPLQSLDYFGNGYPAWYLPQAEARVDDVFALQNMVAGYQVNPPETSPVRVRTHYFATAVGNGFVCGPRIRYVAGGNAFDFQAKTADPILDSKHLNTYRLPDGAYLIANGPRQDTFSRLGTGQCGACNTAEITIFRLSPAEGISVALSQRIVFDQIRDGDIRVSPDWQTVTLYQAGLNKAWTADRFCFNGKAYQACGSGPSTPPPEPRNFKLAQ